MVVRWPHKCRWKAIAQDFPLFSQFIHLEVGMEREFIFGKIYGGVINHFVQNTHINIESFLREI